MTGRGIFITGTDTGIGKTTVGTSLVAAMVSSGVSVFTLKPIETGCSLSPDGSLFPADAMLLRQASSFPEVPLNEVIQYRFAEPLAPAVAAERATSSIHLADCISSVHQAQTKADWVVIEGAGGLLVPFAQGPLNTYLTVADVIAELKFPVLVVARATLGTLNHTLLTVNELARRKITCLGVILNQTVDKAGVEIEDNARVLKTFGVQVLAEIPYFSNPCEPESSTRLQQLMLPVWNRIQESIRSIR